MLQSLYHQAIKLSIYAQYLLLILRVQVLFVRRKIKEQTTALFAGGELSEEDQAAFIEEMESLFLDAKEDAKKFTPKKYL